MYAVKLKFPDLNTMTGSNPSLFSRSIALVALSVGWALISSAFSFYYVKVFLDLFHIQESWFQLAQVSSNGFLYKTCKVVRFKKFHNQKHKQIHYTTKKKKQTNGKQ